MLGAILLVVLGGRVENAVVELGGILVGIVVAVVVLGVVVGYTVDVIVVVTGLHSAQHLEL